MRAKKFSALTVCAVVSFLCFPLASCKSAGSGSTEYDMVATYSDGKFDCEMKFTYENTTGNALDELKFQLYPNAYREGAAFSPVSATYSSKAYYDGINYGNIQIDAVEGAKKFEVGGVDENILIVTLEETLYPDEKTVLDFDFTTNLAKVNHRLGICENSVNLANFYPVLCGYDNEFYECVYYSDGDPFFSECADYSLKLTVARDYSLACSGEIVRVEEKGENLEYTAKLSKARDFAMVLGKDFKLERSTVDGVNVLYYYFDDEKAAEHQKIAERSLKFFSDSFGAYPYKNLSVVQTGFCYGGMEYPALVMINSQLKESDYTYTIVHENAHQWWYALVGNNEVESGWMDEGLSEYSCALFYDKFEEYGLSKKSLTDAATKAYRAFCGVYEQIFGEVNTSMERSLKDFLSEYEYANVAYNKGLILFSTLEDALGEERMLACLRKYAKKYSFRIAKAENMITCFNSAGVDVEGLFSSFLTGKGII